MKDSRVLNFFNDYDSQTISNFIFKKARIKKRMRGKSAIDLIQIQLDLTTMQPSLAKFFDGKFINSISKDSIVMLRFNPAEYNKYMDHINENQSRYLTGLIDSRWYRTYNSSGVMWLAYFPDNIRIMYQLANSFKMNIELFGTLFEAMLFLYSLKEYKVHIRRDAIGSVMNTLSYCINNGYHVKRFREYAVYVASIAKTLKT